METSDSVTKNNNKSFPLTPHSPSPLRQGVTAACCPSPELSLNDCLLAATASDAASSLAAARYSLISKAAASGARHLSSTSPSSSPPSAPSLLASALPPFMAEQPNIPGSSQGIPNLYQPSSTSTDFASQYQSAAHSMQAQQQSQLSARGGPGAIGGIPDPALGAQWQQYEQSLKGGSGINPQQPTAHLGSNPLGRPAVSSHIPRTLSMSPRVVRRMLRGIGVPSLCLPRPHREDSARDSVAFLFELLKNVALITFFLRFSLLRVRT